MIGLAFFLPLDLSFSCWFFFLLRYVERIIGFALGSRYFPALNDQAAGAWLALFLISVWVTRQHLFAVIRHLLGFRTHLNDSDEPMPYRWATAGLFVSIAALAIFARFAGMQVWVFGIFFGLYFMLSFAITRVRAELGTPHEIYEMPKTKFVANFVGHSNLFDGYVSDNYKKNHYVVNIENFKFIVNDSNSLRNNQKVSIALRYESIYINNKPNKNLEQSCEVKVKEKIYMGSFLRLITFSKCGIKFTVDLKKDDPMIKIKESDNLNLCWKINSLKILQS